MSVARKGDGCWFVFLTKISVRKEQFIMFCLNLLCSAEEIEASRHSCFSP